MTGQRAIELGVVEHEAGHPHTRRHRLRLLVHGIEQLCDGPDVAVHAVQFLDAARMTMRIDEAGGHRHPRRVDHLSAGRREIADVGVRSDRNEPAAFHRERFGAWLGEVARIYPAVHDDEIRFGAAGYGGGFRRQRGQLAEPVRASFASDLQAETTLDADQRKDEQRIVAGTGRFGQDRVPGPRFSQHAVRHGVPHAEPAQ